MALYLVGDVQGCLKELQLLLAQVNFDAQQDQLWLTGDLVARGPQSLETLHFVKSLGKSANFVLGNHDLHLLAIHAGHKRAKQGDKLTPLLDAPDVNDLMDWLSQYPLLLPLPDGTAYMSHAGISPQWSLEEAVDHAEFAHEKISGPERSYWLNIMYGEKPNNWFDVNTDEDKFRFTINSFTRMRYCYSDGSLEFDCKEAPQSEPENIAPWYQLSTIEQRPQWVFGHWAALMGSCSKKGYFALDTGCVWGNYMTMLRWDDKKIFIQESVG
ncbi:symmetrical bis(5'-nucleosyl)-tetraphosphatase [Thalassotalea atypica]|uniref:symmetrical bis(5'-nucleosyl)-tetraphosphatase n=1 Tax=Thalassotalea atypica TaxID=2054316 RepID=UPI0025741FD5|nr:symmetrical bis(5'-nucleosyl)-tetraphosphatase [Thalassotalea atypica]